MGDIVVTGSTATTTVAAASYQGVDQGTPADGPVSHSIAFSAAATSVTVTSAAGDMVVDGVVVSDMSPHVLAPDVSQTVLHAVTGAGTTDAVAGSYEAGAGSVAMDWTLVSPGGLVFSGAHVGMNLNASSSGTGSSTVTMASGSSIDAGAGTVTISVGGEVTLAAVSTTGGNVSVTAADATLNGAIGAGGGIVSFLPATAGQTFDLGATGGSGDFVLTDAELDLVTTTNKIVVGDSTAGDVTFTGEVSPANATTLEVVTGGDVTETATGNGFAGGTLVIDGDLAPGLGAAGTFGVDGSLTFASTASFEVNLDGTTAGTEYDQLVLAGAGRTATLGGASLALSTGYSPAFGDTFVIIDNQDSGSSVSGTFTGLAEGATFTQGGHKFQITYQGGTDGNDVVLTSQANAAPTDIAVTPNAVAENEAVGAAVGTLSTTDPNTGDTHTYALVSGDGDTDNGSFQILGDALQTNATFDHETQDSFHIRVRSTDQDSLYGDKQLTITITDVNEAPTDIGLSANTVAENTDTSGGHAVGTLSGTDPDTGAPFNTLTFTIQDGADAARFSVDGSNNLVLTDGSLDYENPTDANGDGVYEVTVRVTDGGTPGLTYDEALTVTVTDANDAPVAQAVSGSATEDGTAVTGSFVADDADGDDNPTTLTYNVTTQPSEGSVVNNNDGTFSFDPGSAFQDLAAAETRDVTFTYTATDSHSAVSPAATATITVTGVNDGPVVQPVSDTVTEDGPPVTGTFAGDDVDSDDGPTTLTYDITTPPAEGSVTNNGNGTFRFNPGNDFHDLAVGETRQVSFTYTATDAHQNASSEAAVTITVTGANDGPQITTNAGLQLSEGASAPITSQLLAVSDADTPPGGLTFTLEQTPAHGSPEYSLHAG